MEINKKPGRTIYYNTVPFGAVLVARTRIYTRLAPRFCSRARACVVEFVFNMKTAINHRVRKYIFNQLRPAQWSDARKLLLLLLKKIIRPYIISSVTLLFFANRFGKLRVSTRPKDIIIYIYAFIIRYKGMIEKMMIIIIYIYV